MIEVELHDAIALVRFARPPANAIELDGLSAAFKDAQNLVPIGWALVIATVLNGLVSADAKAMLVFLRWHHALPGHRAFSVLERRMARFRPALV